MNTFAVKIDVTAEAEDEALIRQPLNTCGRPD